MRLDHGIYEPALRRPSDLLQRTYKRPWNVFTECRAIFPQHTPRRWRHWKSWAPNLDTGSSEDLSTRPLYQLWLTNPCTVKLKVLTLNSCFLFKKASTLLPHSPDWTSHFIGNLKFKSSKADNCSDEKQMTFPKIQDQASKVTSAMQNPMLISFPSWWLYSGVY